MTLNLTNKKMVEMEEFRTFCDIFSKAGLELSKILHGESDHSWNNRQNNFEDWIEENKDKFEEIQ